MPLGKTVFKQCLLFICDWKFLLCIIEQEFNLIFNFRQKTRKMPILLAIVTPRLVAQAKYMLAIVSVFQSNFYGLYNLSGLGNHLRF